MHLGDKLSACFGVYPSKKIYLNDRWIPLTNHTYITLVNDFENPQNTYDLIEDVLKQIYPALQSKGVDIIHILTHENGKPIEGCTNIIVQDMSELSYLIKKSLCHICTDMFSVEISRMHERPTAYLVGTRYPFEPLFSKEAPFVRKFAPKPPFYPNYGTKVEKKQINQIRPEAVAEFVVQSVFKDESLKAKTESLFIGKNYGEKIIELVPDFVLEQDFEQPIVIRFDKCNNAENAAQFLLRFPHRKVFLMCDDMIRVEFLSQFRSQIHRVSVNVTKYLDNQEALDKLIAACISMHIPITTISESEENLSDIRLKLIDHQVVLCLPEKIPAECETDEPLFVQSTKVILQSGRSYPSFAHAEKKLELAELNGIIDSEEFWADSDYFKIFKRNIL